MTRPQCRASFGFLLHNPFHTFWHKIAPNCTCPAELPCLGGVLALPGSRGWVASNKALPRRLLLTRSTRAWKGWCRGHNVQELESHLQSVRIRQRASIYETFTPCIPFYPHTDPVRCQTALGFLPCRWRMKSLTIISKKGRGKNETQCKASWLATLPSFHPITFKRRQILFMMIFRNSNTWVFNVQIVYDYGKLTEEVCTLLSASTLLSR